ncbi:LysE/ArgO family amino acid transporter [Alicyclobacillus sp. ALC3]|uniref:LysE/ArgO family amino acid transporter n=1 Tax=Alicyclobacillus sp. ALC3 TaxID=2796143 RepID=UPI0023791060|nr:LysE family transporter [Alicyclobacillus sp. ALC3]WDL99093.1 LysE family transporter [Alicyclobacillus sp. ALC3]
MLIALINGLVLAIGLILPLGMQNGFVLTQGAFHKRWVSTLPTVITAGLCDTFLIGLAVLGVSATALRVPAIRYSLGLVGIIFLVYLGIATWRKQPQDPSTASSTAWTAKKQIGFTLSVSLLNPHALIDTLAVIGGSAVAYTHPADRLMFGLACVSVSWFWFFTLATVGHFFAQVAVKNTSYRILDRVSAVMMWASAIYLGIVIYRFHG